jgi:hypothetical protein
MTDPQYYNFKNTFMKKSIVLLIAIFCLSVACKREFTNFSRFSIDFANLEDTIYYDSVSYAIINYSDHSEIKDSSDQYNPDVFSHSEKIARQSQYSIYDYGFTVTSEHFYVIKKFDLVSKSGKVIFFIPYDSLYYIRDSKKYPALNLPFSFKAFEGGMVGFYMKKK